MVAGGVKCIKWLVFVFNFLFFLTGCGLIGIGVWLNIDRDDWEGISDFDYISVANVAIAAGAAIIIIAFLGCCGAITENKVMLMIFFIFLLIVFLLEIGAGIAAYVWRGDIEDELKKQLDKRIPDRYYKETGVQKAMNAIQKHFHCCGINNIHDWENGTQPIQTVDQSCCKSFSNCQKQAYASIRSKIINIDLYNQKGCYQSIKDFLEDNLLYVGITGVVFAVFQLLGMTFAMILYCAIRKEDMVA